MNVHVTCLSDGAIQRFLQGDLPADRMSSIEEHVAACEKCRNALHESAGDATWWSEMETALRQDTVTPSAWDSLDNRDGQYGRDGQHGRDGIDGTDDADDRDDVDRRATPDSIRRSGIMELLGPTDDPRMLGRIGPYEIVALIGQGGMGAVFKAFDAGLHRFVAIKILLPHLAASGAARQRFRREGQAAAAVVNDHVLPIYVVDQWRGTPYLVMQYLRGSTLQQRLSAEGPLPIHDVLRIGLHAARGLEAAHAQGLVHRDVKPSNILLDGDVGRAVLADFGLARAADDASLTRSGMLAGTPQYMSPEQIRGERLDQRSDLFSLGSVLYAICTGHPPFRAESSYAVMRRITDDTPRPLREINPNTPPWLEHLVNWLMAKDADGRPASASVVAALLQQCLAHLEQPDSVSLPNELKRAQVTFSGTSRRRIIMLVGTSAMAAALIWGGVTFVADDDNASPDRPVVKVAVKPPADNGDTPQDRADEAVNEADGETDGEAVDDAAAARMTGSTKVAGYTISLEGVGELGDITEQVIRFRPSKLDRTSAHASSSFSSESFSSSDGSNQGNSSRRTDIGFGSTSDGGQTQSFTSSGGGAFGPSLITPTLGIALKITPDKNQARNGKNRYAELGAAVKIVELDGTVEEAKDRGPIVVSWPKFEKQFPGTSALYVQRRQRVDVPLKEIHGELKITSGRRVEAVFSGAVPQQKTVDRDLFVIKSVEESPDGLTVVVSFPPTSAMKKARNMFERMQVMMAAVHSYELEIEDTDGNLHTPIASASAAGGGSAQTFASNGSNQRRSSRSTEPDLTTISFRFSPISAYSIKQIVARVVETDGEPETFPFTIHVRSE